MGPDDSLEAIRLLEPRVVLPSHYGTWPEIEQDVHAWAKRVNDQQLAAARVLVPGATITIEKV